MLAQTLENGPNDCRTECINQDVYHNPLYYPYFKHSYGRSVGFSKLKYFYSLFVSTICCTSVHCGAPTMKKMLLTHTKSEYLHI